MDLKVFFAVLGTGVALVIAQGVASWFDGYLSETQIRSRGIKNGWSFLGNGAMWADVFIISPIVAYLWSAYPPAFFSTWGIVCLGIAILIAAVMVYAYQQNALTAPESHTHHGKTTLTGWIHAFFAAVGLWVMGLAYFGLTSPPVPARDMILVSAALTPFFYLAIVKFEKRWVFTTGVKRQVAVEILVLWVLTAIHIWRL